jgi:hypothetical protein
LKKFYGKEQSIQICSKELDKLVFQESFLDTLHSIKTFGLLKLDKVALFIQYLAQLKRFGVSLFSNSIMISISKWDCLGKIKLFILKQILEEIFSLNIFKDKISTHTNGF